MKIPRITRHFLKGWRTRIVAGAVALLGLLEAVDPYLLAPLFGYQYQGFILLGLSLLMFILREITDSPAGNDCTETWFHSDDPDDVSTFGDS